jgi:hypothetical protein
LRNQAALREPDPVAKRLPVVTHVGVTVRRRLVAGALASVIVLASVGLAGPATAYACSCADQPLAQHADEVVAAFVGVQIDRVVEDEFADDGVAVTFDVDRAYVGDVASPFTVRTNAQSSACGLDVANLGQVAVVAFGRRDDPRIGLCGSLRSVDELVRAFGRGFEPVVASTTIPDDGSGGSNTAARLGLLGVLLAIVGAGGVYVVRQRRS